LQLAVAVLHHPAMLILDEPTSGVDPVERDEFWRTLIHLSRDDGVTIFISTHFMNEAERACMSSASRGLPNSFEVPSVGARRPVSIFIVVDLPQPFEPRKPKISPREMRKLTWSTAVKLPNRLVRPSASMAGTSESSEVRGRTSTFLCSARFSSGNRSM